MTTAPPPASPSPRPAQPPQPNDDAATLAVSSRAAAVLAYSAGWVSGAMVLALEGQRLDVRRHAAQALLGFGFLTLVIVGLLGLAGASLFFSIALFRGLLWAAQGVIVVAVGCWVFALVQAARGRTWQWPLIARRAERLAALDRQQ